MSQINLQGAPVQKQVRELKKTPALQTIINMTPAEAEAYVETNVTDLASAKALLKLMAKVLVVVAKRVANA